MRSCSSVLRKIRSDAGIIDEQHFDLMNAFFADQIELFLGDFMVALDEDFFGLRIDDVMGSHAAENIFPARSAPA